MDKNVKPNLIVEAYLRLPDFEPISKSSNPILFKAFLNKFRKFETWDETFKINKKEFEKHLNSNDDLVDAYLDVYSNGADYYRCTFCYEERVFEHNLMQVNKKIVLFFIREHAVLKLSS